MIFISEIGMNYNANFNLIYEMIRQSKLAGADICKFQLGWKDKPGEINELNLEKIQKIVEWCEYFSIEPMFSIISANAYKVFKKLNLKKIKIASRSLKYDYKLVEKIVNENTDKKIFLSLGMWEKKNKPFNQKNIKYLYCKSNYPTFNEDVLGSFPKTFGQNKDLFYGYSDHFIGIEACLIAITRGAKIIEKHFTLDKSENIIRDHALSATPDEFKTLVNLGREIHRKITAGI